jgi:hypothetical protein
MAKTPYTLAIAAYSGKHGIVTRCGALILAMLLNS